jgi:C4-dicarboxylate-binding protein DctP
MRTGLEELVTEVTTWGNARAAAINAENLDRIKADGQAEILTLAPEEIAAWQEAVRPVWDQFTDAIGPDIIAAAQNSGSL